jgi:hypothetical protein
MGVYSTEYVRAVKFGLLPQTQRAFSSSRLLCDARTNFTQANGRYSKIIFKYQLYNVLSSHMALTRKYTRNAQNVERSANPSRFASCEVVYAPLGQVELGSDTGGCNVRAVWSAGPARFDAAWST